MALPITPTIAIYRQRSGTGGLQGRSYSAGYIFKT